MVGAALHSIRVAIAILPLKLPYWRPWMMRVECVYSRGAAESTMSTGRRCADGHTRMGAVCAGCCPPVAGMGVMIVMAAMILMGARTVWDAVTHAVDCGVCVRVCLCDSTR